MKIGAITPVYNDEKLIGPCIKCLNHAVDKHVVLVSEKPYFGENSKPDKTAEIAEDLGADVLHGNWELDHFQRNTGLQLFKDYDWVLTFDSDELITKYNLGRLVQLLETTDHNAIVVNPKVYWKDTNHCLYPRPGFSPIIAVRPNVRFTHIRNVNCTFDVFHGEMHHLSWCEPKDILKKVLTYAHANDFDGLKWYNKYYKDWNPVSKIAELPTEKFQVRINPLPNELREYFKQ